MQVVEFENDEVKKALMLTREEAEEAIKALQEQLSFLDTGRDCMLVIEYND